MLLFRSDRGKWHVVNVNLFRSLFVEAQLAAGCVHVVSVAYLSVFAERTVVERSQTKRLFVVYRHQSYDKYFFLGLNAENRESVTKVHASRTHAARPRSEAASANTSYR